RLARSCATSVVFAKRINFLARVTARSTIVARVSCWLRDCCSIEVVSRRLAKQKDVLVRLGAAVAHALRHRVRLVPDDVLAQIPAIGLESESYSPGDADQVFRLEVVRSR